MGVWFTLFLVLLPSRTVRQGSTRNGAVPLLLCAGAVPRCSLLYARRTHLACVAIFTLLPRHAVGLSAYAARGAGRHLREDEQAWRRTAQLVAPALDLLGFPAAWSPAAGGT